MKVGDYIVEHGASPHYGLIIACGRVTYDVIWIGGGTSRYRHGVRKVDIIRAGELDAHTRKHLRSEAAKAKAERRRGAGIRRGQIWP